MVTSITIRSWSSIVRRANPSLLRVNINRESVNTTRAYTDGKVWYNVQQRAYAATGINPFSFSWYNVQ